ncbi:protein HEG homolog 1-like [Cololabis saira]|uniref:protein HEG homolog 1-like n=1 Tax=Cololabis saira TaxID=129043 RepID=UPI002AD4BB6E|nr:protein HEG homolog 1-like [Cololabis saira]
MKNEGYSGSTVLKFGKAESPKGWLLRTTGVTASVQIIYKANSAVTDAEFKELMSGVICKDCALAGSFESRELCTGDPCDVHSTTCKSKEGVLTCTCKDGYFNEGFCDRICSACPHGEKYDGSDCVSCPFGYTGFNCEESWKLILVIVGSVLGALLLTALILLGVVASKSPKVSSKRTKNEDFGKPYVSHSAAKSPLVNGSNHYAAQGNGMANGHGANLGVPRIPQATTTNSWDSRTNLEMTPSNSRQNLVPGGRNTRLYDDQDDQLHYAQSNPYATSLPQSSSSGQNRAGFNPYTQNQGQSNPYYVSDERGRYN